MTEESGSRIYYTTDGSTPQASANDPYGSYHGSNAYLQTVRAFAYRPGWAPSPVVSQDIVVALP